MHPGQRHESRGQERMRTIVVDYFAAFDNAECGAGLRRNPAPGTGGADRNGIGTLIAGKRLPLSSRDAQITVGGIICRTDWLTARCYNYILLALVTA